jgi:tRNA-binding protein
MNPYECFKLVDMRVGRILSAEDFPQARKAAYKLTIDFGEIGVRRSSAQITALYGKEELVGRLVIAVTNLQPRRIAGFESQVLVLGVPDRCNRVVLLEPAGDVEPGALVY